MAVQGTVVTIFKPDGSAFKIENPTKWLFKQDGVFLVSYKTPAGLEETVQTTLPALVVMPTSIAGVTSF